MELRNVSDKDLRARLEQLPTLPAVVLRLMELSRHADDYFDRVHELLEEDPPFATRMLQMANSAMYAPVSPINTLYGALTRLGANRIAQLVTSAAVTRVFVPSTVGQRNLWIHSVQTACAARKIASASPSLTVEPEEAYLAGLLHDIARFLMFQDDPQELMAIETRGWSTPEGLCSAEFDACGWNHAELGHRVCETWNLPGKLQLVIGEHHNHDLDERADLSPSERRLIRVVQMADALSMMLLYEDDLSQLPDRDRTELIAERCVHPSWTRPPIAPEGLAELIEPIQSEAFGMSSALGLYDATQPRMLVAERRSYR